MLWVVGSFILQEGPTTYYVIVYTLCLYAALIFSVLMRVISIHEAGNFVPCRLCKVKRVQRGVIGFIEALLLCATIAFVILAGLILFPYGPWASDVPRSAVNHVTGSLYGASYVRTDVLSGTTCSNTISSQSAWIEIQAFNVSTARIGEYPLAMFF